MKEIKVNQIWYCPDEDNQVIIKAVNTTRDFITVDDGGAKKKGVWHTVYASSEYLLNGCIYLCNL